MNGKRAFDLLNRIGFERVSATSEELKCANILKAEIESVNGMAELEEFEVDAYNIKAAKFEVLEPEYKEYFVTGYGGSGSTPEEGLEAEFYYVTSDSIVDIENAKGKICLVNPGSIRQYKKFIAAGAVGFITFNGDLKDSKEDSDIAYPELRRQYRTNGIIPGVNMLVQDAEELVLSEPTKVRLTLVQEDYTKMSHNVVSEIKGTDKPEEIITLTAHYDSVKYSTGVYDNGAGSVINMEAYRYFMENKPKRTLKFIWCGSEERGLLGSKAWVLKHEEELKNIKLSINCDVAGPVLGTDRVIVTGNDEIVAYCKSLGNEIGFPAEYKRDIYSSDNMPFADKNIPAISITRFGTYGTAYIHNRHDVIKYLDYKNLEKTGDYLIKLVEKIDKSNYVPFDLSIPADIKDKVDKYLFKKE